MIYNKLGKTNLKVSRLGFGGFQLAQFSLKTAHQLLAHAHYMGINFFDTSRDYRNSEELIGDALKKVRDTVVLSTKMTAREPFDLKRTLNLSLKKLKTHWVDIYCMHGVNSSSQLRHYEETVIPSLEKFREEGSIKYIGLTTHHTFIIEEALANPLIDVFYTPINVLMYSTIMVLAPLFKKYKKGLVALKPFGGWNYSYVQGQNPRWITEIDEFDRWLKPSMALGFLFRHSEINSVLCGFTDLKQIDDDIHITISKADKRFFEKLSSEKAYCLQCLKCKCPNGIRIPFLLRLWQFYDQFNIKKWVETCYNRLEADYRDCDGCKVCEQQCPEKLNIIDSLRQLHEVCKNGL